jgi:ABC-2 type transport system permease protein
MSGTFRQALVVARRDFIAVAGTPTFLIFLLAPLMMLGFGILSGTGAAHLATNTVDKTRIIAITDPVNGAKLVTGDTRLREIYRQDEQPPKLMIVAPAADPAVQARYLFGGGAQDVTAVMYGPVTAPQILFQPPSDRHARYLGRLAEDAVRADRSALPLDARLTTPKIEGLPVAKATNRGKQSAGFGAVFVIFFLTLLLAGQSVGMLAEEKSNKVIEVLAAAVPLEAVFLGKLMGMFGVALLFIGFWGTIAGIGISLLPPSLGLAGLAPAVGIGPFLALCVAYFTMAFMLLGAVFLGVGAQASTMREIQMLSLPITLFQVGMFGLSSAAAGAPGTGIATFAEIFPFSSPFAMAARAATDPVIWPHLFALAWQILWVGVTIWMSVGLFRMGVLKSGNAVTRFFGRITGHSPTP